MMKKFWHEHSLTIVVFALFFLSFLGLSISGFQEYNSEQKDHREQTISYPQYLVSSHFQEAVFENWESEFLQMWALVLLTVYLKQKGSAESKKIKGKEEVDTHSRYAILKKSSMSHEKKAFFNMLYRNSLGLALLILFIVSFILHGISGSVIHNDELKTHGEKPISTIQYMLSPTFWFESFQNWQSEFLSVGVLIVLTIYLRQHGSAESKPVGASNNDTGK